MMCNTEDGRGDYENLRKICTQIDLVSIEDVYGRNSLQRAVIDNKLDFVSHLLTLAKLHQPSVDTLIFHRDCQGKSSLHYALECHNIDILFTLLFNLSDEWKNSANWLYRPLKSDLPLDSICPLAQLLKLTDVCKQINLISVTDSKGCNVLQQCVISDNMNLVFQLLPLAQFHRESLDELIGHTSNKGLNAIQYALLSNNSRVTERLMSSLSETNKNTVCQVTDTHGNNLLHLAASLTPSVDIANTLYSLMDSAVMKRLRKQTNMYGETPRDVKSAQLIRFHVSSLVRPILSKSTQNSLVSAIVSMAVKSDDLVLVKELCLWFPRLVKQWLLTNLCNTPMATAVIEVMSSVSDHFIIPPVQKKARKYAFVCYTSVQRKGALGEAETLAEVLRSKGFIVDLKEWKCFGDLRNWLVERTNKVRSRCSVVSVCLLSHGFGGNLIGENNSRGEIAEIIDETRKVIPPMIPLVSRTFI